MRTAIVWLAARLIFQSRPVTSVDEENVTSYTLVFQTSALPGSYSVPDGGVRSTTTWACAEATKETRIRIPASRDAAKRGRRLAVGERVGILMPIVSQR